MSAADLPALYVSHAIADRVKFGRGSLPEVSVSMAQTAKAMEHAIGDGRTILGGYPVTEVELICLMSAMREAGGLARCDRCGQWSEAGHACGECGEIVAPAPRQWGETA